MTSTEPPKNLEEELDSDITSIRAEIRSLNRKRRFLTSSLLSSTSIQKRLRHKAQPLNSLSDDVSPLAKAAASHSNTNHHRIAFSATTFPFTDPSPNVSAQDRDLLGVRIDVCAGRGGRFSKPYYLLLRRGKDARLRVHRHTIPGFIAVEKLEGVYLPRAAKDGEEGALKPWKERGQDLAGLVRELRRLLVAWQLRVGAVRLLRETLGVVRRGVDDYDEDDGAWERGVLFGEEDGEEGVETRLAVNDLGIVSLGPTALEANYVRLEWKDGRVGRFKISPSGVVERAVVIGDQGRDRAVEMVLTGGDGRVETVLDRLKKHVLSEEE